MKKIYLKLAIFAFCSILLIGSCRKNDDTIVHISKEDYTIEDQKEIGKTLKALIMDSPDRFNILDEADYSEFYNYLNTLMNALSNTAVVENRSFFHWDATIIHDDNIRTAFITPGGHLFIYTGLLKFLQSESELVGILAHEINYAESSYLIERLKSEFGKEIIGDLLLGNDLPETRDVANNIPNLVFPKVEVSKADQYSINLICPFQYNAFGLSTFLDHADRSDLEIHWLSTRPGYVNRISRVEALAVSCGEEEPMFSERYENFKSSLP